MHADPSDEEPRDHLKDEIASATEDEDLGPNGEQTGQFATEPESPEEALAKEDMAVVREDWEDGACTCTSCTSDYPRNDAYTHRDTGGDRAPPHEGK